jgi:hypothetical protein
LSDWQLDRLPGDVRREAENAAQGEGLPLHRWLGKLIRETCAEEGVAPSRELSRGTAIAATGNGHRHQPVVPPRPIAEPIRVAPLARAVEPSRPVERPAEAAPPARTFRATNGREAPPAAAPIVRPSEPPRAAEPPRQPSRVAATARETIPPAPSAPQPAPATTPPVQPPSARLSTISSLSTASPAPRGMPPMSPLQPTPTQSRFSAEARPASPPPRQEPIATQAAPAPPQIVAPVAVSRVDDRMTALGKLVQSLRRNELSPVGEARLFLKLMTEHMASIGDITIATGRTKEQVARSLRLLGLSDRLRDLIDRGALSREQAFALLDTDDPDAANPVIPPSSGRPS